MHPSTIPGRVVAAGLVVVAAAGAIPATAGSPAADIYRDRIRPLLADRCTPCHGGLRQEAELRLDTAALMVAGGASGPAVRAGHPDDSLILGRVSDPDPATRMPPEGEGEPLVADEVALLRAWIEAGCPAPHDEQPEADPRDHWAFRPRIRPAVPAPEDAIGGRSPIDAFLQAAREQAGLRPQAEAPRHVLIRRLYLDLVGLPPDSAELAELLTDTAPDWYEALVERLLADPRHGERWARHWMDVWRYADWWGLGSQHRNSQKHMWHFRDWIVESLNDDVGYDEMVRLMLAADELHPDDLDRLRATGFLARNWFLFNRGPWLDETVEHVGKGLLGLTLNCAKCHAHKYDPIRQEDYFRMRAFFEPIETRVDILPGEADLERDGIPRVFDGHLDAPTHLLVRGDDARPDTSESLAPGVPQVLAFAPVGIVPVALPRTAFEPERRPWVLDAYVATARRAVAEAEADAAASPSSVLTRRVSVARARLDATLRRVEATRAAWEAEARPSAEPDDPLRAAATAAARAAARAEKDVVVAEAWATVAAVSEKLARAVSDARDPATLATVERELAAAREAVEQGVQAAAEAGETFTPFGGAAWTATRFRNSGADDPVVAFPARSSGRRTALARWMTDPRHPLTARVAVNQIWMRHLGRPLVASVFEFGRKGTPPDHPELLDWLASELVDHGWSMKHLHRLICTSAAYRMDSSVRGAEDASALDPDNRLLWRREPLRLEAQVVRDAILSVSRLLDPARGGPPVPESDQATSRRRSLYFWHSDISRNLFLSTFDDAAPKECYQRERSIVPQQALALANAAVVHEAAAAIAARAEATGAGVADDTAFLDRVFFLILQRGPSPEERSACGHAVARWRAVDESVPSGTPPAPGGVEPARVHLVWSLLNHNDFVTLR